MSDDADPVRVHFFAPGDEGQGVLGVGHLVEAANLAARAFAFAATAKIDAEDAIAHFVEHAGDQFDMGSVLGADKAVQDDESRQTLPGFAPFRHMQNAGQFQTVGHEGERVLHGRLPAGCGRPVVRRGSSTPTGMLAH